MTLPRDFITPDGQALSILSVVASVTLPNGADRTLVLCDSTPAALTVTLPQAPNSGFFVVVGDDSGAASSLKSITVTAAGGTLLDDAASYAITSSGGFVGFEYDGSQYRRVLVRRAIYSQRSRSYDGSSAPLAGQIPVAAGTPAALSLPALSLFGPATMHAAIVGSAGVTGAAITFGFRFWVTRAGYQCTGIRFVTPSAGRTQSIKATLYGGNAGPTYATKTQNVAYAGAPGAGNGVVSSITFNTPVSLTPGTQYTAAIWVVDATEWWNTSLNNWVVSAWPTPGDSQGVVEFGGPYFIAADAAPGTNNGTWFPVEPVVQ